MKTEELLNDLDTKLFNIHAMLFSGNLNKEELQSIKEELRDYLQIINNIQSINEEVYKLTKKLLNLICLFLRITSLLMLCFIILDILILPIGIGLFIFLNFIPSGLQEEYIKLKENDEITFKITKLTSEIKDKQELVERKLKKLTKLETLQITNSQPPILSNVKEKSYELPKARVLKLENRQI